MLTPISAAPFYFRKEDSEFAESIGYKLEGSNGHDKSILPAPEARTEDVVTAIILNHFVRSASSLQDLFDNVDRFWGDLGHPMELSPLVTYMPAIDPNPSPERLRDIIEAKLTDLIKNNFTTDGHAGGPDE